MKPTYRHIAIISLSTLLITSAGATLAFGGPKDHGFCDRDGRPEAMAAVTQLDNLTPEQKTALKNIRRASRDAMLDLRDEMQDNRTELRDAIDGDADMATIRNLAEKQGDQITRMIVLRAETRGRINNVLNEEQRQQLQDMRGPGREFGTGRKRF